MKKTMVVEEVLTVDNWPIDGPTAPTDQEAAEEKLDWSGRMNGIIDGD